MIESPHHELDEVIDRVAAKMVAIDDTDLLQGVLARLPERSASPWFLAMPVQLAATTALVLVAFLYARPPREDALTPDLAARPVAATYVAAPVPVPAQASRNLSAVVHRLPTPGSDSRRPRTQPRARGCHRRTRIGWHRAVHA